MSLLGLIAVGTLWVCRKKEEAQRLRASLATARARAKVGGLKAEQDARDKTIKRIEDQAQQLEKDKKAAEQALAETVKKVDELDGNQLAEEFKKRGY
jgi:hypothetical protein